MHLTILLNPFPSGIENVFLHITEVDRDLEISHVLRTLLYFQKKMSTWANGDGEAELAGYQIFFLLSYLQYVFGGNMVIHLFTWL